MADVYRDIVDDNRGDDQRDDLKARPILWWKNRIKNLHVKDKKDVD